MTDKEKLIQMFKETGITYVDDAGLNTVYVYGNGKSMSGMAILKFDETGNVKKNCCNGQCKCKE